MRPSPHHVARIHIHNATRTVHYVAILALVEIREWMLTPEFARVAHRGSQCLMLVPVESPPFLLIHVVETHPVVAGESHVGIDQSCDLIFHSLRGAPIIGIPVD